jgi:hypothetical protein
MLSLGLRHHLHVVAGGREPLEQEDGEGGGLKQMS